MPQPSTNTHYKNWLIFNHFFLKAYLLLISIFTFYRLFFFLSFKKDKGITGLGKDIAVSFWVGFKFDTMVALYLIIPLLLLSLLLLLFLKWNDKLSTVFKKISSIYFSVALIIGIVICVVDYYFFLFFQSHLNILVFGLLNDDTKAVVEFLYNDYPLVKIVILLMVLFIVIIKYVLPKLVFNNNLWFNTTSNFKKVLLSFMFYVLVFLGLRGTLPLPDSFPLLIDDATVSVNTFINTVTLNPLYALKDGYKALKETNIEPDMFKITHANGFNTVADAYNYYSNATLNNSEDINLFTYSNTKDTNNLTNVVFIQMESMSNQLIDFHHKENLNLLGSLEAELQHCYTFRNTLSCNNGTIFSLEGLLINTPTAPLSQSKYMKHPFSGSCALPFYNNGYETQFITGAKLGWRNLEKFLPAQYFKQLEGDASIMQHVPKAQANEWGVFDEFLFDRIEQNLQKATKPTFIYAMTTSNHARFTLPSGYKPLPITLTAEQKEKRKTDVEIFEKNLATYQYANNCLGNFISKIRNSPLGKNTIIVATGDHNILGLFNYSDEEMFYKYSVPIIFYVPSELKPNYNINTARFASHKDIFPSIYNLCFRNAKYVNLGNNLFADSTTNINYFAINESNFACNEFGAVLAKNKLLFKWKDYHKKLLMPIKFGDDKQVDLLLKKSQAYNVLAHYYLHNELTANEKH